MDLPSPVSRPRAQGVTVGNGIQTKSEVGKREEGKGMPRQKWGTEQSQE